MTDPFRAVVDDLTGGCGCACHTGIGYNTACAHCRPGLAAGEVVIEGRCPTCHRLPAARAAVPDAATMARVYRVAPGEDSEGETWMAAYADLAAICAAEHAAVPVDAGRDAGGHAWRRPQDEPLHRHPA